MTKNDQNLIAVHDALFALGTKRAFFQDSDGNWHRYRNLTLEPNMFQFGAANKPPFNIMLIGRPKPKVKG